jgi:RNA recognition motif-containing protein
MTNIFVGNLAYQTTESELEAAFAAFGTVDRVSVVRDRDTGQPRGFAFVEMANSSEAENAIKALNGTEMNGRAINVNEARPREQRSHGGGGGGFGRSSNRGGGYGGGRGGGRREPRW